VAPERQIRPVRPAAPSPQNEPGRQIRYRTIADELREEVASGRIPAGGMLPSESELVRRYGASRVTVRKALEVLRAEGLADARQGFGWYASGRPLQQSLGRLGTIEAQLAESGRRPERRVLDFAFVPAPARLAALLGCDEVLRVSRLNLADGVPFARVTVWVPAELGSGFSRDDVERTTFHDLLAVRLGGAVQTIGAGAATKADAEVLGVEPGSPVLRCERTTVDESGRPVIYAEHVFPAGRTEFVVELSAPPAASMAPSGLRLVE